MCEGCQAHESWAEWLVRTERDERLARHRRNRPWHKRLGAWLGLW